MSTKHMMALNVAAWVICLAGPAYAYVDPGTGSMMVQMIIAGAAAGFTTIGLYWTKLVRFIRRDRRTKTPDPD